MAEKFGDAQALVVRSARGRAEWSYLELHRAAREVARALAAAGVGKASRVGILMANRAEYITSLFGIAMAGGVAVALNTFSTPAELQHQVQISGIGWLLFDGRLLKQDFARTLAEIDLGPDLTGLVELDSVTDTEPASGRFSAWADFLAAGAAVDPETIDARARMVDASDAAGVFFSSGTTAQPKAIVHCHRAFTVQWWRWPRVFAMREPVRSWTGNGFFWSGNVSMTIGTALSTGGAMILQPAFDADQALAAIEEERVTFLGGRPHQWARVQSAPRWADADLSSLKYVTKGDLVTDHPSVQTDWHTPNAFGTSETMTICTAFDAETSAEEYGGSVGGPLPGNALKIVDPVNRAVLPVGQRGEMCIKGPTLMSGYLGKTPEQCFDDEGYYCTGDGGYVDAQGRFFWEGRLTAIIKSGGANVSPDEVDAEIARFPGVKRCQTVGVPDDLLGEVVVACIVPLPGATISTMALLAKLKERLASFKLPRHLLVLSDEEFALTANEKPVIAEIRRVAAAKLVAVNDAGVGVSSDA
ncbi:class I adenylate-forming enzyme family protein [Sphingomonas sp. 35-24ZXX]|uniref:class I adenylate-forming enzyme family protein n=1 Tax=Sphingomonas sp. 35-24ZXX TaxID=1545915 RepID=UPI001E33E44E|nr:class I adenylate-forming enzyme family protein [Sphingomonas sp. 35-24ZXX]